MATNTFQLAARQARQGYTDAEWHAMGNKNQAAAIYRALRRLDAEVVAAGQYRSEGGDEDYPDSGLELLW